MFRAPIRAALAALLVLAQMLAPLAHSHGRAAASGWIEVCTGDGLRRLPAGDAPAAPLHDDDHCVLCRVADPTAGAPPFTPAVGHASPVRAAVALAPAYFGNRPTPHDAPARAPPRAP